MLQFLKVAFGLIIAVAMGLGMAIGLDWLVDQAKPRALAPAPSLVVADGQDEESTPEGASAASKEEMRELPKLDSGSVVEAFIAETDPERRLWELRREIGQASIEELEDLFIEAMSYDLENRLAFQVAGATLKRIAQDDPDLGLGLLYTLSPAEKEKLVWAVTSGWAIDDAATAWDWISTAWIGSQGNFIDRDLQNRLHRETVDVLLKEKKDYPLAASLVSSVVDPDLKRNLADLIAFRAVRDNPSEALGRIDFESNDYLDTAIMDAIVDEWAQRDSVGAKNWTLDNERQVSTKAARYIAKHLLLNEVHDELRGFHRDLVNAVNRDSVAAEATRLLARRDPVTSVDWLGAIQSPLIKQEATYDALYEIGHDSFESTIQYVDLAYDSSAPGRAATLYAALESWSRVDGRIVSDYLDSGRSGMPPASINAMKESLGIQ